MSEYCSNCKKLADKLSEVTKALADANEKISRYEIYLDDAYVENMR
jgi:phage-related tail protein